MEAIPLLQLAIDTAIKAGKAILNVYYSDFAVDHKSDHSPLTQADRDSHCILSDRLAPTGLPIQSEEGRDIPFNERCGWRRYWLLDPLDGTKEFVKRNGEFTVNIALIDNRTPVLGVVYAPVPDTLYFGTSEIGAFKMRSARSAWNAISGNTLNDDRQYESMIQQSESLPQPDLIPDVYTIVGSRSHGSPELLEILEDMKEQHGEVTLISAGSSLKLCMVAEGRAHIYPRTGPTMEWDTGAGQAIAEAAGAVVLEYNSSQPLRYNKEDLLNPWFVVKRL